MAQKTMFTYPGISTVFILVFAALIFGLPIDLRSDQNSGSSQAGTPSKGKTVFENLCLGCHTIGEGPETGPDLKGVTERRSFKWLKEFIKNPEKMFSENDPTAKKLLTEYGGLKMPVLGLSDEQIDDVLAYIGQQSQ